jgi:hypothetical protein
MHTMWNAGPTPARMIEVISPAGFEHFFRALAEFVAAGPPPTPETVPNLAAQYGPCHACCTTTCDPGLSCLASTRRGPSLMENWQP